MSNEMALTQPAAGTTTTTSELPADAWGQPISTERQAELQGHLDRWQAQTEAEHGDRKGPFDNGYGQFGVPLTGADVSWLAKQSRSHEFGPVPNLHLERADLSSAYLDGAHLFEAHLAEALLVGAHLNGADLRSADLAGADLEGASLDEANLSDAHLERTDFSYANLEGVHLGHAHLEGADFKRAHLDRAHLFEAHLQGANFNAAHLDGADLRGAHLEGAGLSSHLKRADLRDAHLEGVNLSEAQLAGADLRGASLDKGSRLNDAILTVASFDQATFDNTNLTVVDWSLVTTLGDERTARMRNETIGSIGTPKTPYRRLAELKGAVRAYRVLAVNLQAQGLAEDASRFAYQAQVLQRQVYRRQRKPGAYLFSWLLAALAGYGFRLRRILIAYALVVLLFAAGYFLAGGIAGQAAQGQVQAQLSLQQQVLDALQVSLNAIHGRVFFTQLGLDTLQSWLATLESIVGIVIEGVFVAMLIQRFFGR